jgi:hypothetical protein
MATAGADTGLVTAAAAVIAAAADMRPTTAALPAAAAHAAVVKFAEAARFAAMPEQFVQAAMRDPAQATQT